MEHMLRAVAFNIVIMAGISMIIWLIGGLGPANSLMILLAAALFWLVKRPRRAVPMSAERRDEPFNEPLRTSPFRLMAPRVGR